MLGLSLATNMAVVSTHKLSGYIFRKILNKTIGWAYQRPSTVTGFFFFIICQSISIIDCCPVVKKFSTNITKKDARIFDRALLLQKMVLHSVSDCCIESI